MKFFVFLGLLLSACGGSSFETWDPGAGSTLWISTGTVTYESVHCDECEMYGELAPTCEERCGDERDPER